MHINKNKIILAGSWVIIVFGISQLVRLGSNLILTRLLSPDLFGVMAIIFVIMYGLAMFSDLGLWAAVVRNKSEDEENFLNTVWTMQVVRGWMMFAIIVIGSIIFIVLKDLLQLNLHGVYKNESLPYVLIAVAVTAVMYGHRSLAPAIFSRDLQRGRLELIEFASQVFGVVVMITWAYINPSIWALASAGIISQFVSLVLLYLVFDVRHRFAWDKKVVRDVFGFGKWIFIASALTYIAQQGDKLFFSAYISSAQLGIYSIAFMLATVVTTVIEQLSAKVWYPVFCKNCHKLELLSATYYKTRIYNDAASLITIVFLIFLAPTVISFLYDSRYHDAGWMLQILALSLLGYSISSVSNDCLLSLGITKVQMQVMLMRSIALLCMLPYMYSEYGLKGAIIAVAVNPYFAIHVQFYWLSRQGILKFKKEVSILALAIVVIGVTIWNASLTVFQN